MAPVCARSCTRQLVKILEQEELAMAGCGNCGSIPRDFSGDLSLPYMGNASLEHT
ncbi:hypothetical protein Bca4012_084782 [Brassica carinata]